MNGAVIALAVGRPEIAVPLALVSHYVTDAIPHWDYGTAQKEGEAGSKKFNNILKTDFVIALVCMALLGLLFPAHKWLIWSCMIAAAIPDAGWYYYFYLNKSKKYDWLSKFHDWLEWSETPKGLYVEAAWFGLVWAAVLWFTTR